MGRGERQRQSLWLLGLPLRFAEPDGLADDSTPKVILSEAMWTKEFGRDPHVTGTMLRVGTRLARIAGVAPNGLWKLPGKVDAWLLEPDPAIVSGGAGYVVAHLTEAGEAEMWTQCVHITAYGPDDSEDDLLGDSIEDYRPGPWVYLSVRPPACHARTACDHLRLAGRIERQPTKNLVVAKTESLELLVRQGRDPAAHRLFRFPRYGLRVHHVVLQRIDYIQLVSTFGMCLFGLRWVLQDQRQRCPVCLRLVEHPAQVGQASRTFLAWNGTELMCMDGHTLLHVPGMPTSWFGAQRWLYLDTSWDFLFAGPGVGIESGEAIG
jgi:hypothetical protein